MEESRIVKEEKQKLASARRYGEELIKLRRRRRAQSCAGEPGRGSHRGDGDCLPPQWSIRRDTSWRAAGDIRQRRVRRGSDEPQRTFHQINSGMIASRFLMLCSGTQASHCRGSFASANKIFSSTPCGATTNLVAESFHHLAALVFRTLRQLDNTRLDGRRNRFACRAGALVSHGCQYHLARRQTHRSRSKLREHSSCGRRSCCS